jgi:hypothetical protein
VSGGSYKPGMTGAIGPNTYLSDYTLWDVKPAYRFTRSKFRVEVGDRVAASRILAKDEAPRSGAQVVSVPQTFRRFFDEDVDQALRDIAGVATLNVSPLIRDRQSIYDMFRGNMVHPFTRQEITVRTDDGVMIEDFFDIRRCCVVQASRWTPALNPTCPRFVHVDLAVSGDCAGMACAHQSGIVRINRIRADGTTTIVSEPFIVIDWMLRIRPPKGSEIDFSKLRSFVLFLRQFYPIVRVTLDGFQSVDFRQIIVKNNIEAGLQSLDKTETPYLSLRAAMSERRIACYRYEPFVQEALELNRDVRTHKVDHPVKSSLTGLPGSKDVADAVCGAVWAVLNDQRAIDAASLLVRDDVPQVQPAAERTVVPGSVKRTSELPPAGIPVARVASAVVKPVQVRFDWTRLASNLSRR